MSASTRLPPLFPIAGTPQALLKLGEEKLTLYLHYWIIQRQGEKCHRYLPHSHRTARQ